uniref:Tetratricopeptide repeat domain protein n=2 Tax=Rickettsia felis TaxID=42862 RepID=D4N339_RICFI|nr:tetratricopeptide repeat domain protein [Rickettsia felis]
MRSYMNISHHHTVGNSSKLFAASSTNQSQYLESDYFLPASYSENYYSRKYSRSISKISRIVSASLLSAMMLTATLDAKAHPSVESSILEPNQSFLFGKDSAGISTNVPLPPIMPQSPPSAPPIPPVLPAMPDFISDASIGGKSDNRSALLESIRNFGKNILKKSRKNQSLKLYLAMAGI